MEQVLVTGITGTLGAALSELLMSRGIKVLGVSRDEQKQRQLPQNELLSLRLADVRDPGALQRVIGGKEISTVYHLAALKCVDTLEFHPYEALQTNVHGTQNVVDLADMIGANLVFTSTDKACYPINAYGASKALAEKIVLGAGHTVVRYGNVLGSRGSFLPNLILSLKTEGKAYLTDKNMTRFWMSVKQAADLVMRSATMDGLRTGLGLRIPVGINACTLPAFAEAVGTFCGVENYDTVEIGTRPGEKIHETLHTSEEGTLIRSNDEDLQFEKGELLEFITNVMKGEL
jgi:FlaA1/EpsC-like NDP-sugar epimerase